jgi:hypothetical protein
MTNASRARTVMTSPVLEDPVTTVDEHPHATVPDNVEVPRVGPMILDEVSGALSASSTDTGGEYDHA